MGERKQGDGVTFEVEKGSDCVMALECVVWCDDKRL